MKKLSITLLVGAVFAAFAARAPLLSAAEPDLDSTRMAVQRFSVDFMDRSVEPGVDFDRFAAGT
jgi:hypothetical protein